ncbi:MAG: DNA internalization-related competence protein ComEC/Rec2 [Gammaproteobacteria bacterium RIFCSPHIGHO2_12_FULL_40_19]|nr:MAG: DNA internalization-related competence protein ComEC/Rec2 [Gammaproteobacteria bacterium RIFCSPHIGHO2_12_FULL_40_19]
MFLFVIAFLLGDLYLQTVSQLPTRTTIHLLVFLILALSCMFYSKRMILIRITYLMIAFVLGFMWSDWYASAILSWKLPKELESKAVVATGYIASLPIISDKQTSFIFELHELNNAILTHKTFIRLSWQHPVADLQVGDQWNILVKLKCLHGLQNPGGFDYEAWALQNGIRATGYVIHPGGKNHQSNVRFIASHPYRYPIHFIRQKLQTKLNQYLPLSATSPWLMALMIGERSQIPQAQWQVLKNTGTNHLMAIAGLHIGMIAGFFHLFGSWCWRRVPQLLLWLPAQHAGAITALGAALIYSALAGFSIPTQRACIMLSVFIVTLLFHRIVSSWLIWSFALLIVLLLNPLSVLTESVWLSFGTIALIIYGMGGRLSPSGWWWRWGRVQWVIGFGLIPLTLLFFQQCSFISVIANTIAIPWLAFFILPFCLVGCLMVIIFPSIGVFILCMADKSLAMLWIGLTWLSQLHFSTWYQSIPNVWVLISASMATLLLLLPAGFPGRYLGVFWLVPLIFYQQPLPMSNQFWVTLLDVGQGLSVVVQTRAHTLVYDAGAKYQDSDMGERVVIPYLRKLGIKKIDTLVISHGDNDHIGGAPAILAAFPVLSIKTSVIDKFPPALAEYCLRGDSWQWDGVDFSFIYPRREHLNLGNDSSCVLHITNGIQSVLLTGDIEKFAEQEIMKIPAQPLASSLLIAPHHGSNTSGVKLFIQAIHPQIVLYSIGYRNRYHFPHKRIVQMYQDMNAKQMNSADSGSIHFEMDSAQTDLHAQLYRERNKRYWMDNPHL